MVDSDGNIHAGYEKVIVLESSDPTNQNPTSSFTFTINGSSVEFDASGSTDSDGTIEFHEWNFGDNNIASHGDYNHAHNYFSEAGSYEVTLKVTDDDGGTHSTTQTVVIASSDRLEKTALLSKNRQRKSLSSRALLDYERRWRKEVKDIYKTGCYRNEGKEYCYGNSLVAPWRKK